MAEVSKDLHEDTGGVVCYIPYLSVIKQNASTTKIQKVFITSSPSSNTISLNQTIHSGLKLQNHIFDVITGVWNFKFVFSMM